METPLHIWAETWPWALPVMLMFGTSLSRTWKGWALCLLMAVCGLLLLGWLSSLSGYGLSVDTISAYTFLGGMGLLVSLCVHGVCLIGRYTAL